jgi:hypothetical protein
MKTHNLSLATFVLGALGASIAACSAQSSGSPPRPTDNSGDTTGGGTGNIVSNGATGNVVTSGGATVSTGGAPSGGGSPSGVAGTTVIAGGSGSVTAGGSGSTPAPGSCAIAAGTLTDLSIDDLEDGDNTIQALGQRVGYWYTYNDGSGTQKPAPDPTGAIPFQPTPGGHSPLFSAETSSTTGFTIYGAGMGFDFNNTAKKSCPYNASVYTGIKFWAKGNTSIRAMIKIPSTTQSTSDSGTCVAPATAATGCLCECENHFGITQVLTADWVQYSLPFATITQDPTWGKQVTFDKTSLIAMQFQVGKGAAFDFSVDDVTFY